MKRISTIICLLLMALSAPTTFAADMTQRFYGYAYDLNSNRYLYTEVHEQNLVGDRWVNGAIRYFAPDGTLLGEKTLDFSADPFVPLYDYALPGVGYREGITKIGSEVLLTKTVKGNAKTKAVPKKDPITADSGFHNFLRANFQYLLDRKTVAFTFIAAGNLDSYKFRAKRIADTTFDGQKAVRFLVEANSLLRIVAPNLEVTYHPTEQRLLEYRGPSNVIDPVTDKVYEARIAYYAKPPADAPKPLPPLE